MFPTTINRTYTTSENDSVYIQKNKVRTYNRSGKGELATHTVEGGDDYTQGQDA